MKMLLIAGAATALMCGGAYAQQASDTSQSSTIGPVEGQQPNVNGTQTNANGTQSMPADQMPGDQGAPPPAPMPSDSMPPPPPPSSDTSGMQGGSSMAPSQMGAAPMAGSSQVVTNGPVPDTKENRAKYGTPMSNAGKRSKPAGN